MTDVAGAESIIPSNGDTTWWYKDGEKSKGSASADELGRLAAIGILRADTLVWQEGFGTHWKRLEETGLWTPTAAKGPPFDHGRWSQAFAKIDADPKARPWSFLGLIFGSLAYFCLGMWTRGLIITAGWLAGVLLLLLAQNAMDAPTSTKLPDVLLGLYCSWNLKHDLYRFRVRGRLLPTRASPQDPSRDACYG